MKKAIIVLFKFIRGIFRCLFFIFIRLTCGFIKKICGEKDKDKQITIKKAKRIRFLTNLKLKVWKYFPHLMEFLGEKNYLEYLTKKMNYGV